MNNLNKEFSEAVKEWQELHLKWLKMLTSNDRHAVFDAEAELEKARTKVEQLKKEQEQNSRRFVWTLNL